MLHFQIRPDRIYRTGVVEPQRGYPGNAAYGWAAAFTQQGRGGNAAQNMGQTGLVMTRVNSNQPAPMPASMRGPSLPASGPSIPAPHNIPIMQFPNTYVGVGAQITAGNDSGFRSGVINAVNHQLARRRK